MEEVFKPETRVWLYKDGKSQLFVDADEVEKAIKDGWNDTPDKAPATDEEIKAKEAEEIKAKEEELKAKEAELAAAKNDVPEATDGDKGEEEGKCDPTVAIEGIKEIHLKYAIKHFDRTELLRFIKTNNLDVPSAHMMKKDDIVEKLTEMIEE